MSSDKTFGIVYGAFYANHAREIYCVRPNYFEENIVNILLVGGFGGHGEQLSRVRNMLEGHIYVALLETGFEWNYEDITYHTDRIVDYHKSSKIRSTVNFFKAFFKAIFVIYKHKIDLLISTGPALSVPICLAAKLLKVKVLHIESWSRINTTSNTTKLILKYNLANVVAYQYVDHILASVNKCEYWGHL